MSPFAFARLAGALALPVAAALGRSERSVSWDRPVDDPVPAGPRPRRRRLAAVVHDAEALVSHDLRGADLRRVDLSGVDLSGLVLRRARLRGADLRRTVVECADLSVADLRRADLRGLDLRGTILLDADLAGADLRGADLSGARHLGTAHLRGAVADRSTTWPVTVSPIALGVEQR